VGKKNCVSVDELTGTRGAVPEKSKRLQGVTCFQQQELRIYCSQKPLLIWYLFNFFYLYI
jgi:hypothetical protein